MANMVRVWEWQRSNTKLFASEFQVHNSAQQLVAVVTRVVAKALIDGGALHISRHSIACAAFCSRDHKTDHVLAGLPLPPEVNKACVIEGVDTPPVYGPEGVRYNTSSGRSFKVVVSAEEIVTGLDLSLSSPGVFWTFAMSTFNVVTCIADCLANAVGFESCGARRKSSLAQDG